MKNIIAFSLLLFIATNIYSQNEPSTPPKYHNSLYGNLSFLHLTLNYERELIGWEYAQFQFCTGIGFFNDLQGGGKQGSVGIITLLGRKHHLEVRTGAKYLKSGPNSAWPDRASFDFDYFIGYRYSNPEERLILRFGYVAPYFMAVELGAGLRF